MPAHHLLAAADDPTHEQGHVDDATWIQVAGSTGGIVAAAAQTTSARPASVDGKTARSKVLDRVAVYRSDTDTLPDPSPVVGALGQVATIGFDQLLAPNTARPGHAGREDADVVVEGTTSCGPSLRFALSHLTAWHGR